MIDISTIKQRQIIKGYKAKFVHTDCVTLAFWEVEKGALLPSHAHLHEQTTQVLNGKYELTVNGKTEICEKGSVVIIPSNVMHGGIALTDCTLLDIFCPIRDDYKF